MNIKSASVSVLGSALFFALAACSGASADGISAPSGDPAAPSASASQSAAPTTPPPPSSAADAGAGDSSTGTTTTNPTGLAKHCPASAATPSTCLENVEGHAGDVVDVEVRLVPSAGCAIADEGYARFEIPAGFKLANEADQVSCISRYENPAQGPDKASIWWQGFGMNDIPSCPGQFGIGKVDSIKLEILPGTPAGDYKMTVVSADFMSKTAACQVVGAGVDFTVRVLP